MVRNIIIFFIAIFIFVNSACNYHKEKVKVEYDITTYSGSDSISVKMYVQSTYNNLILFSPVQDNAMGLKKLSITDKNGTPLKFIQKTSSVKALNRVFNFTSYKVEHSNKQEMFVNYQCKVGLPETEITSGYAEVTYGSAAKDYIAFSLRNVLLCPNPKTENITFRFHIPDNHQLLTSWGAIDTVTNYHFNEPIENIIDIPVVVMKSCKKLSFKEESHISFYAPPSVKIEMNKDIEKLSNLYKFYARALGLQHKNYNFVLLPESRKYQRCYIKPTPILQVLSFPLTSVHIKQAAEGIVKPNLMSTTLRNLAAGCSEEWLLMALNHYYTFKHHQIIGDWEEQLNKIYPTYAFSFFESQRDLIEQFDTKIHRPLHPLNFQIESIIVFNFLDKLLKDEFNISNGLNHVVKETIKHRRKNGFISHHIKELIVKNRLESFIKNYAQGKKIIEFDLPESIEHIVDIPMGLF